MIQPLTGKASRSVELATARFNVWEGAVRSSKTVASIIKWMRFVRKGPAGNLIMIGKTERTLKRNVIDPIIAMVGASRAKYLAGAGEFWLYGRRIYVAGANDARSVEKVQGLTLAGAYGDELANWPEELFDMLGTRFSIEGAQFFGTCNPAGPVHWLKSKWLNRAAVWLNHDGALVEGTGEDLIDLHRFSFVLEDNPHLPRAFVDSLRQQYQGLFFKRYILGLWVPAEGAIFDMFDEDTHVVSDLPLITRWISLGVDHGTRNPFHAVLCGLGTDRRLHLVRDWRWDSARKRQQLADVQYSKHLRDWLKTVPVPGTDGLYGVKPERTIVDPSAKAFRVQLHNDGLPSIVADNAVEDGIRTVSSLFSAGLLDVHESCAELIREIQGYSWDDEAAEKGVEKPLKVADHGPDAMRYAVHTTRGVWRSALRHRLHLPD
ncbi:PBSX family phage terminase large subunit [Catellatospora coxensis]|uniref:Phage terminase large subunit n=1 Tax=Catellatospora coxensis TaxID=310354 RepID=A0A8J3PB98_9ACTN|nr:terminase family protein [Catellatospora coxensis]GIG10203.1 phage terminase large subunit [Catellatospora coxensis]